MPAAEHFHVVLWEVAMEASRVAINPNLPSRMNCTFVCGEEKHARQFRDRFRQGASIVELAPVGATAVFHEGDFALISDRQFDGAYADFMASICAQYWREKPEEFPEILYPEDLAVVRVLS